MFVKSLFLQVLFLIIGKSHFFTYILYVFLTSKIMKKLYSLLSLALIVLILTMPSCIVVDKKGNNGANKGLKKGWKKGWKK